jgi:hypothetical protein
LNEALDKVRKSEYARLSGKDRKFIKGQKSQLSGYKSNRFNWLEKGDAGSCGFGSLNA